MTALRPFDAAPSADLAAVGTRLVPVTDRLWRVHAPSGRIVGHLGIRGDEDSRRFLALRYHPGDRRFREVGAFWSVAEAVECLRLSR